MPNITIAVKDDALLREARSIAARRGTSISELFRKFLAGLVHSGATKTPRSVLALRTMRKGLSLGGTPVPRESLHDR